MADSVGRNGAALRILWILLLIIALGLLAWVLRGGMPWDEAAVTPPAPEAPAAAGESPEESVDRAVEPSPESGVEAAEDAAGSGASADPAPEEEAPADPAPSFDVVRVEPDGNAVIAGRAAPGSRVTVTVDGEARGDAEADASGNFVAILDLGMSDAPRAVGLSSERDGARTGSDQVVVVAPAEAGAAPAEETAGDASAEAEAVASVAEPEAQPAEADAGDETAGVAVVLAEPGGVRVLQRPDEGLEAARNVVIDAITYDEEGEIALSGRAPGEGSVRVYIDNSVVETGRIGPDGDWRVELPDVETGTYTLRVDQLDATGTVTSRAETPFRRENPETIQALAEERAEDPSRALVEVLTVQPGNTLWGISERLYGEGQLFVRVFEANRTKIRDPDLIYPGQVFSVPN